MSMTVKVAVQCPHCGDTVSCSAWTEHFGADADGNRGINQTQVELDVESCPKGCEWTSEDVEAMMEAAAQEYESPADGEFDEDLADIFGYESEDSY